MADIDRTHILAMLNELKRDFRIPFWSIPDFLSPEERVDWYKKHDGRAVKPVWEIWVELPNSPDADHLELSAEPTRASVTLSSEALMKMDVPAIAARLAVTAAGRNAHEVLEFATLKCQRVANPHPPSSEDKQDLRQIAQFIYDYLMVSEPRTPHPS